MNTEVIRMPLPTGLAHRLRLVGPHYGNRAVLLAASVRDPLSRLFVRRGHDPYPTYEQLRAQGPLVRSPLKVLSTTSYDLCDEVLRSADFGLDNGGKDPNGDHLTARALAPLDFSFLEMDPPEHTRLRRLATPAFRPKLVRSWRPRLESVADRLLDEVAGQSPFDLMSSFASKLPIAVISDLVGISSTDTALVTELGHRFGRSLDGVASWREARDLQEASQQLIGLFEEAIHTRAVAEGDDIVALAIRAERDGQITPAEMRSLLTLLVVAGFETTTSLIGNAVSALADHPQAWRELVADPEEVAPKVVEETLRWDPPVQLTSRMALRDTEVAGQVVPAGTQVVPLLAAANRDPERYADPGTFDFHRRDGDRDEPDHLSFSSGIHYCLGAPLARLEAGVALVALATRLPHLRVLPGARRIKGTVVRGWDQLPVAAA